MNDIFKREASKLIFKAAIDEWGYHAQMVKTLEECGELITALAKYVNMQVGSTFITDEKVVDELADVSIMLHQMKTLFGVDKVEDRIEVKMVKLADAISRCRARSAGFADPDIKTYEGHPVLQTYAHDDCDLTESGQVRKGIDSGVTISVCSSCMMKAIEKGMQYVTSAKLQELKDL